MDLDEFFAGVEKISLPFLNRHDLNIQSIVKWFIAAAIACYLSLFLYNSITRTQQFSPDSMNYVDVAHNIASGRGIVQSTLGFNEPLLFQEDSQIPAPLVSQPPLYPLLIALLIRTGLAPGDAALVIPALLYGFVFLFAYILAKDLYGEPVALLAIGVLLIYAPLSLVSRYAWSESLGIGFTLLALWLLARTYGKSSFREASVYAFFAGITAGLAFGARYALLPLSVLGIVFLVIEHRKNRQMHRVLVLYILGVSLPIALVMGHNFVASGQLIPGALPSDRGFITNLRDVAVTLIARNFEFGGTRIQMLAISAVITAGITLLSVIVLVSRRRAYELVRLFVYDRHYLLTLWVVGYTSFIVYQRSVSHFDPIGARIMAPVGVILIICVIALLLEAIRPIALNRYTIYGVLLLMIVLVTIREIRMALDQSNQEISQQGQITSSERLNWIAQNTQSNDLIIGDDTMDIPFYFDGRDAVSFSPYPYTIHLTYEKLMEFADYNQGRYRHIYIVLRGYSNWQYDQQVYHFGKFIADIKTGEVARYSGIRPIYLSNDMLVFEVTLD